MYNTLHPIAPFKLSFLSLFIRTQHDDLCSDFYKPPFKSKALC